MAPAEPGFTIRELRLRQFRNFRDVTLHFPAPGVAIIGDNGAGKTNLLEAIYYLEIFRSFRAAPDEQLVHSGAEAFHVRGVFRDAGRELELTAAYEARTRRKRITVDGVELNRLADGIGRVGAVIFSPADLELVAGAPAQRRRFLDILLSLGRPGYLTELQRYRQVLRQRNALLRRRADPRELAPWNDALVQWGSGISAARARWVSEFTDAFDRRYRAIGGAQGASLVYRPGFAIGATALTDAAASAAALAAELERVAARERRRQLTLAGPHRDDLVFMAQSDMGFIDLRAFGSGGQLRSAAIALRMVEAEWIRSTRGRPPLILLDDVFAELDPGRSRRILALLDAEAHGQVILTAPKESDVELRAAGGFVSSLAPWRIAAGSIAA
jgi:DNA replication and repair protein RecF